MQDVGGETSGPLDEIEFWRSRSVNLSGIRSQLDDPAVGAIVAVLEYASSSYLAPFLDLRNLIHRCALPPSPWLFAATPSQVGAGQMRN